MNDINDLWKIETTELLKDKIRHYSDQEKENIQSEFLFKSIQLVDTNSVGIEFTQDVKPRIEYIIHLLPEKKDISQKIKYRNHSFLKNINHFKNHLKAKYKVEDEKSIQSSAYALSLCLGVALGPLFGLMVGKYALGICLGIPIGLTFMPMIKKYLLSNAEKNGILL